MAVPKKKTTRQRRDKRRTHDSLTLPNLVACPHCKALKRAHRVCSSCGYYGGKEVKIKYGDNARVELKKY